MQKYHYILRVSTRNLKGSNFLRGKFWERKDLLLFYLFSFALFYVNRRYALQLVPVSSGWTAEGLLWCWAYLKKFSSPRTFRSAVAVLAVIFLGGALPKTLKLISRNKAYLREAGRYLKDAGYQRS